VTTAPGPVTWLVLVYRLPAGSGLKAAIRPSQAAHSILLASFANRSRFDLDPVPVQA
jgi:hypothetical protein